MRVATAVWMAMLAVSGMAAAQTAGSNAAPAQVQQSAGGTKAQLIGSTVAGTAPETEGELDTTGPGMMVFRARGKADVQMPYEGVFEFGFRNEQAFHLGFFPAMFYGMVAARPQRHLFSVSWHDASGHPQEATFELPRDLSEHLQPVMYSMARNACERAERGACLPVVPAPRGPSPAPQLLSRDAPATTTAALPAAAALPADAPGAQAASAEKAAGKP